MEYNRNWQQLGQPFAAGDCKDIKAMIGKYSTDKRTVIAYTQLQALKIQILEQIIVNLRSDSIDFNYAGLQQCADSSKSQAIDCLGTLRQRLLQQSPIQALPWNQHTGFVTEAGTILPESMSRASVDTTSSQPMQRHQSSATSITASPSPYDTAIDHNPWENEVAGSSRTRTHRGSISGVIPNALNRNNTNTTRTPPVNIGSNTSRRTDSGTSHDHNGTRLSSSPSMPRSPPSVVSPATPSLSSTATIPSSAIPRSPPVSPPVKRTSFSSVFRRRSSQAPTREQESIGAPLTPSTTSKSPTTTPKPPSQLFSSTSQLAALSFYQPRTIAEEVLPAESNSYLGLCRSAYRMQVGRADALQVGRKTISAFTTMNYLVCSKNGCYFEGVLEDHKVDRTAVNRKIVRGVYNKIYFRWSFMFKCHLPSKGHADRKFGCVFCSHSASSNRLPVFHAEAQYLGHILDVHMGEGRWPDETVLGRLGAVVSSTWPDHDNWDLLLLNLDDENASSESRAGSESFVSLSRQASVASGQDSEQVYGTTPGIPELDRDETDRFELSGTAVLTPTSSSGSIPPILPSIGYGNKHTATSSSDASLLEEVVEEEDSDWPMHHPFPEDNDLREQTQSKSSATIRPAPSSAFDTAHYAFLAGAIAGPSAGPSTTAAITKGMSHMTIRSEAIDDEDEPQAGPVVRSPTAYLSLQ